MVALSTVDVYRSNVVQRVRRASCTAGDPAVLRTAQDIADKRGFYIKTQLRYIKLGFFVLLIACVGESTSND